MKTRLIFLLLLIVSFSCGTNNKPVSDAQKEKIKSEVKEVMSTIIKGVEESNFDMFIGNCLNSPDFVFLYNGNHYNYQQFADLGKTVFATLINAKCTIVDEKYMVIDNSNVLCIGNSKWIENYKDGHAILDDPWVLQYMFKKVDNKWKVIIANESGVEKSAKNTETSKGLNQVELMKQFIGSWKYDLGKDTTGLFEFKPFGTGVETYNTNVTKGKIILEWKELYGYDKKNDKIVAANLIKGEDIGLWALWFISNNKYIVIPYSDIANPEKASFKVEGEFKSPNLFVETLIINGKPLKPITYTLIK